MTLPHYQQPARLPTLTKEEWAFFHKQETKFFRRYNLHKVIPLWRRIGMALHTLAVSEACGVEKNQAGALNHYQKACQYFPHMRCSTPEFRKSTGLTLISSCVCNL